MSGIDRVLQFFLFLGEFRLLTDPGTMKINKIGMDTQASDKIAGTLDAQ